MRPTGSLLLVLALLLGSCSGLKYSTHEKPLFAGVEVVWEQGPVENRKQVTEELLGLVEPEPNNTVIWMRPTVALHNMVKEPKEPKGLGNLLRNKIGSAPVQLADVPLADLQGAFINRLNNHGYFQANGRYEVETRGRRAFVTFHLDAGPPHRLRNISYASGPDPLNASIAAAGQDSPLKPGQLYDLGVIDAERSRVVEALRDRGWYRIKDKDLVFAADTSMGGYQMDVRLRVKATTEEEQRLRYKLGSVRVHGDYDALLAPNDSAVVDSVLYINYLNNYRPSTITRGVFLRPGQYYSAQRSSNTTRFLGSYGVFKSTEVNYTPDPVHRDILHADVVLAPLKRWSLFSELNAVSKSNSFAGPGMRVGLKDRDLFRGAEIFTADINGRFEVQVSGPGKGTTAYEVGLKTALQIPRLVPFNFIRSTRSSAPMTRAEMGYGYYRRTGLYGLAAFNASYGFAWRTRKATQLEITVPDISFNSLFYSSADFDAFLDTNQAVKKSFEDQFIMGVGFNITVSSKPRGKSGGYVIVSFGFDESGNIPSAIFGLSGPRPEEGYQILGNTYSQFLRFRPELRFYSRQGRHGGRLVGRLLTGVGVPYGNSEVVPYVRQFFVGGTNSVRAFQARSVGPGTYRSDPNSDVLIDQTGDIRLEANLEYRFVIAGYVKGAVFADAGNVWLVNDDPQRPGGEFIVENVPKELAVGAGFGIRFDPGVIVVRLDLATPLSDPSRALGERWVFERSGPGILGDGILNIAIGYPF